MSNLKLTNIEGFSFRKALPFVAAIALGITGSACEVVADQTGKKSSRAMMKDSKKEHGLERSAVRSGSGVLVEKKELDLRGAKKDHFVAKVKVNSGPQKGKLMLLNFGEVDSVPAAAKKMNKGDTINFSGRPGRISERPVLMVTGFNVNETPKFKGFSES